MVLTMQDKWVLVIQEKKFQLPVPSECEETIENLNQFLCFLKRIQYNKGLIFQTEKSEDK